MIFTKEQWRAVMDRMVKKQPSRISPEYERPDPVILSILELDGLEHGVHPTWVKWWLENSWTQLAFVIVHYEKPFPKNWDEPKDF